MKMERTLIVSRSDGLHARPAGALVKLMKPFESDIQIKYKDKRINANSIVHVMQLALRRGEEIQVLISGADAKQAFETLESFLEGRLLL